MTPAERQILLLTAEALHCLWLDGVIPDQLATCLVAARAARAVEELAAELDQRPETSQGAPQAGQGVSRVNPVSPQFGAASNAPRPRTGHVP